MTDIIWAGIISIIFLSLFVIAEILRKKGAKAETTRKFVHFDYKKSQSMYVDALKDTVFYYTSMEGANVDSAYNGWTRIE